MKYPGITSNLKEKVTSTNVTINCILKMFQDCHKTFQSLILPIASYKMETSKQIKPKRLRGKVSFQKRCVCWGTRPQNIAFVLATEQFFIEDTHHCLLVLSASASKKKEDIWPEFYIMDTILNACTVVTC